MTLDLDAIRDRDAAAYRCDRCGYREDFPWHAPLADCEPCVAPQDHHACVKGLPAEDAERDRRDLLAEVDRLRRVTQVIGDRLDEALVSNALLTNEAGRLRDDVQALAKMQSDEWKALTPTLASSYAEGVDDERARALPVITAAKALRDNTHLIHDVSYQEWADPLWDALMEYERSDR